MAPRTTESYIQELTDIYNEHGVEALHCGWLKKHKHGNLYNALLKRNITLEDMAKKLNVHEAWEKTGKPRCPYPIAMDKQTIIANLRELFDVHGISVLFCKWLMDRKADILHYRLLEKFETTLEDVAKLWNVHDEYLVKKQELADAQKDAIIASRGLERWNLDRIHRTAKQLIEDFGCLPPHSAIAGKKEYGAFSINLGKHNILYEDLRKQYGVPNDLRLIARNGITFRSAAEAAVANFLIVRGIDVLLGKSYPKESGRQWTYDLHFKNSDGNLMDVEVWGGEYSGGQERIDNYEQNKAGKLEFNKNNPNFVHLHVDNCWKDDFLTEFFRPYIGDPEVQILDKIGELVPAVLLATADSTIQECKKLCERLKVEEIPCRQWFLRTGKFADRKVEDWECGHLAYDIPKLGGWNKVRLFCKLAKHAEDTAALQIPAGMKTNINDD